MWTRSIVQFREDNKVLVTIYQQYDGYLDGVGKGLSMFLNSKSLVNGYTFKNANSSFNGVGCMAAQYIEQCKDGYGNLYITFPKDRQQYNYIVNVIDNELITIKVICNELNKTFTLQEFTEYLNLIDLKLD